MIRLPPVLDLAIKSVISRRVTACLTVMAIAVSVMLFAGVKKIQDAARTSFERTISGTDLIVGARTSPINLLLYSIFHVGNATNNLTWQTYEDIASRKDVAWTVPLSLGDSHRGYRVVGTTADIFDYYQYGHEKSLAFAAGRSFDDIFDAVLGADVADTLDYRIGQNIIVAHGIGAVSFTEHNDKPFKVAGILKPTGTPLDRSILIDVKGLEAIHIGWQSGTKTPLAGMVTPEAVRALDLQPRDVTAILVGLESKIGVLRLQRQINTYTEEPLLSVIPGVALAELWQIVGVAQRTLSVVSGFVIAVGLVGITTSIFTSLSERRREMAILRAVGARPRDVFLLLVSEAALLAFVGSVLGLALLFAGFAGAAPMIQAISGIALAGIGPELTDLWIVLTVTATAFVLAGVPAWQAFQSSLADGLTVRF